MAVAECWPTKGRSVKIRPLSQRVGRAKRCLDAGQGVDVHRHGSEQEFVFGREMVK